MTKNELRKIYKEKRKELSSDQKERAGNAVVEQLLQHLHPHSTVAVFLPIKRHHELDITSLLSLSVCKWLVSKSDFESGEMQFYVYEGEYQLKKNDWGIPEPQSGKKVSPEEIDSIIIPMLICDMKGHRVGYGKGFYDRFLPLCRRDCKKIGVNFFAPVEQIEDSHIGDAKIDALITPQRFYQF